MRADTPQFEALLESAPDAILLVDGTGRIVLINRRTEEMFGYSRDVLVGMPIDALVPERYRGAHGGHRDRYLGTPGTRPMGVGLALAGRRADGSEFPVEISLSPMQQDGETLVITIVRDTTERSGAEARFRALLESAPDAILLVDGGGRIVLANRRSEEVFGYEPDELLGEPIDVLVPERFRGVHPQRRGRYLHTPRTREMGAGLQLSGRRRTGEEFPVEIALSPFPYAGETLVITIVRDITDRRAAEAERLQLARVEAARAEAEAAASRLSEIMRDLDAIVWESDTPDRGRFTFMGGRAEAILGYPAAAWTEEPGFWRARLHAEDAPRVLAVLEEASTAGAEHELEYRLRAADGRDVWVRDLVHVVPARDGEGARLRGVMVDVTERRELEARLLQSQKMEAVGQLAGGIAHDFNNLLTVISGFATLLSGRIADPAARSDLREIEAAAERATALTQQLLAFSRRGVLSVERIDLDALVRGLEPMLRRLIDEDIAMTVSTSGHPNEVEADAGRLEQALVNLVVNARDAMPRGGTMRIATSQVDLDGAMADAVGLSPGRYARLLVADTGTGMDPATLERAFEPFFTTKAAGKGTGLGLSTVYGSVEQAGGRVTVDSEPGRGTEFILWLPAAPVADGSLPAETGRATILLVEDEPSVRRLARTILEAQAFRVLEADNGGAAFELAVLHRDAIDLVLTDIVMPGLSGPELVERLSPTVPGLRVLYMSGYADSRLAGRGVDERELPLLRKPFKADELVARVEQALAGG